MTIHVALIAIGLGLVASIIGGIFGGITLGGKHLGKELAGLMGGFYGPIAGLWGIVTGVAILHLLNMMGV